MSTGQRASGHHLIVEAAFTVAGRGVFALASFASADARVLVGEAVTLDLPDGATLRTTVRRLESVRHILPKHVVALQFDPEVTKEMLTAGTKVRLHPVEPTAQMAEHGQG